MIIIPYTYKQVNKMGRQFHVIRMLTEGGQAFWTEPDALTNPQEALDINDIRASHTYSDSTYHYFKVDDTKTAMNSMYDWTELPLNSDTLCWRTFYTITDDAGHPWIQLPDSIFKPALEKIQCLRP